MEREQEGKGDLISPSVGGEGRGLWGTRGSWKQPKDLRVKVWGLEVVGSTESPVSRALEGLW